MGINIVAKFVNNMDVNKCVNKSPKRKHMWSKTDESLLWISTFSLLVPLVGRIALGRLHSPGVGDWLR